MNGTTLPGAIIEITDLKTGAVADSNGNYHLNNLPKGSYLVEIHLISYATLNKTVSINGNTHQDFQLNDNIIEKNEVVVTGASLATEEKKSLTPIQSISIKEIQENASSNVIDAVTNLPGVTALTTGPSVSKPVIRGLGYNRIITLNDGVRQEGQQWGDEHGIEIDDYNVSRIEVLKGPASMTYGSDALAGVVNIISTPDIPLGKITGKIVSNYQTNSGLAALHADIGGNQNGLSWNAYVTQKDAHDYQNKYDGYVFDTRFHNTDYGVSVGINKARGSSRLSYTSFNEKTGIPEGNRDSLTGRFLKDVNVNGVDETAIVTNADNKNYAMTVPYQHIQHQKIVWDNSLYLSNGGRVGLTLGYQRNMRQEFGDVVNPDQAGLSLLLQTATYDLKYNLPEINKWQIAFGLNGMSQWNTNDNATEYLIPDYNLFDGGVYAVAKKDWKKWTVSGGVRYDMRTIHTTALTEELIPQYQSYNVFNSFTDNFSNVSGSLGAGYNVNSSTILKLNVASGYRAPNIAELSENGVHDGTNRYEIGNTGLKPEKSIQADLGVVWTTKHAMISVSLFDNYITNYIFIRRLLTPTGTDSIPSMNNDAGYAAYLYSQSNANLYGGEIYIDLHPHPLDWLHLENTFSYVRGKFTSAIDSNSNLPYMPPARWLIELRAQKKTLGNYMKNAYAKFGIDINFDQNNVFTAYGTETPAKGYTLLDAGIGADITNRKHQTLFTLTLAGQNLADVAYQNALSRFRYLPENYATGRPGIYNMGRNFSATVSIPLNIR